MDSANSSSMQTSSGGDEEYDSRADQSFTTFLDHHHQLVGVPPPPPPPQNHNHHDQLHFDNPILSNYFENNPLSSSSSSYTFLTRNQSSGPDPTTSQPNFPATSSLLCPPPPLPQIHHSTVNVNVNGNSNNNSSSGGGGGMGVVKRSKKRSRASRRAPTTVLTTDTSNFRAMVQEFTGIPSPPLFTNNIVNTRLNTFLGLSPSPSSSSAAAAVASHNFLLRPFVQKLIPTSTSSDSVSVLRTSINNNQLHHGSSSSDIFQNLHLQSLLQVPASIINPRSDHNDILKTNVFTEEFGLGGLQGTDPPSASMNRDGEKGDYANCDHLNDNPLRLNAENKDNKRMENPNEGTVESWLCSSSDQRT